MPVTSEAFSLLHRGTWALALAERQGLCIDVAYCNKTIRRVERRIENTMGELQDSPLFAAGRKVYGRKFNPASNDHLAQILYSDLGHIPSKKTASGKASTDEESLRATGQADIVKLLECRKLEKIKTTYLGNFLKEQIDGVMHPFFNLNRVITFRSSSSSPNFQNIPNRDPEMKMLARQAIIPRPGHLLLCADYSGAEVRIANSYHHDPTMTTYNKDSSKDMHRDTALELFKLKPGQITKPVRNIAKGKFVFAQFYGDWYKSCAEGMWQDVLNEEYAKLADGTTLLQHMKKVGIGTPQAFENHVKKVERAFWYTRFPVYAQWKVDWWEEYQNKGYFDTYTGFRCQTVMSRNDAVNYPIQGSAFHCLLWSLCRVTEISIRDNWKSRIVGQIHDEMVLDVHPSELEMVVRTLHRVMERELLEHYAWITVPMLADVEGSPVDTPWSQKGKLDLSGIL